SNIKALSTKARKLYKHKIGFLFQDYALIQNETVFYNLSLALHEKNRKKKIETVLAVLKKLGIDNLLESRIDECSGGECQRIAIARLLLQNTEVILADEPTGSLDNKTKLEIFKLLKFLKEEGKTIIVVTHDEELSKICDRVVVIDSYEVNS
ncbi:MAG: ATP-binding cassette domain-containing protein, partial [Anaerorhabdus sp.]